MDDDLRNGLWNALTVFYWNQVKGRHISRYENMDTLLKRLWQKVTMVRSCNITKAMPY